MERLLSIKEFAAFLGKSAGALYQLKHKGYLPPAIKVGASLRWREADIATWLESNREDPR